MVDSRADSEVPTARAASPGPAIVYLLLMLLALAGLAPSVILPEWRSYQALRMAEQVAQDRLDHLQGIVEGERRRLRAMRTDPAAMARLAQRELRYHRPGERAVLVSIQDTTEQPTKPTTPTPVAPPALIARAVSYLPSLDYDGVFCDDETRRIVMGLSLGLMIAAFALFGWPAAGRAGQTNPQRVTRWAERHP